MAQEPLKNLLPKLLKNLEDINRSPSTILAYRADLEQLLVYLHGKNKVTADQVKSDDIEGFRDDLLGKKYTPPYNKRLISKHRHRKSTFI